MPIHILYTRFTRASIQPRQSQSPLVPVLPRTLYSALAESQGTAAAQLNYHTHKNLWYREGVRLCYVVVVVVSRRDASGSLVDSSQCQSTKSTGSCYFNLHTEMHIIAHRKDSRARRAHEAPVC